MREIKFRGKRVDTGEWVYGDLIQYKKSDARILKQNMGEWDILETGYKVGPKTVGQYTGLKDKNGKEIYEGDIVRAWKYHEVEFIHEVEYRNGVFWFGNWNWIEFQDIFRGTEIIGNIYENPELLEGV